MFIYLSYCVCCMLCCIVNQKTAYAMRISDWSSDVCSSDLPTIERSCRGTDLVSSNPARKIDARLARSGSLADGRPGGREIANAVVFLGRPAATLTLAFFEPAIIHFQRC